jgi:hypothetical protein
LRLFAHIGFRVRTVSGRKASMLAGDRVLLRAMEPSDAETLWRWHDEIVMGLLENELR